MFTVDLSHQGVEVAQGMWHARGLAEIPSGPVTFHSVPARPIGEPGWYLTRPGFWWGGIGVAACWYGGAIGIARAIQEHARNNPNPHLLAHLGGIDTLLHASSVVLANAAERVDAHHTDDGRLLAKRVRALVARTCEEVLTRAGHALGPSPLALDAAYSKQVADLQLYIRQHTPNATMPLRAAFSLSGRMRRGDIRCHATRNCSGRMGQR